MSYFNILDFVKSGRKSLENKNYWSALSVALSLPSMCSRIEFSNQESEYKNFKYLNKGTPEETKIYTTWKDKECYIGWCENNLSKDLWIREILGNNYANILYQLRCDLIHAGIAEIYSDNKGIFLSLGENGSSTTFENYKIIDIGSLCLTLFEVVESWTSRTSAFNYKYTLVFDRDTRDGKLLYDRLCDVERANYLEKQFYKENEKLIKKQSNTEENRNENNPKTNIN